MNFSIWFRQAVLTLDSCTWNMFRPPVSCLQCCHIYSSQLKLIHCLVLLLFWIPEAYTGGRERERETESEMGRQMRYQNQNQKIALNGLPMSHMYTWINLYRYCVLCVSNICHGRHTDDLIWQHYLRCTVYTARVRWIIKSEIVSMAIKFV